jgi:hypothetical protein
MSSGTAEDAKEATCRVAGFLAAVEVLSMATDAALQAACQPAYDQCAAMASMVTCTQPTATCMATMREYRACLDEVKTVSGTGLDLLPPCDELTLAKVIAIAMVGTGAIPPTPACDTFNDKCPDFELPVSSPTPPM